MDQSQGLVDPHQPTLFCLLHKAIYGLKQAHGIFAWQTIFKISDLLGPPLRGPSFVRKFGGMFLFLLIYVDDIVLTGNNNATLPKLLMELGYLQ